MPQQRPQMIYSAQMQHHWQNNQPHHSRMMYPQADNGLFIRRKFILLGYNIWQANFHSK